MTIQKVVVCNSCGATNVEFIPHGWIKCRFHIRLTKNEVSIDDVDFCSHECLSTYINRIYKDTLAKEPVKFANAIHASLDPCSGATRTLEDAFKGHVMTHPSTGCGGSGIDIRMSRKANLAKGYTK